MENDKLANSEPPRSTLKDKKKKKSAKKSQIKYVVVIMLWTFCISMVLTFASAELMDGAGYAVAFALLAMVILIGIVADIVGVSVTAADEKPFHSMSARKVNGAKEAVTLIRNADKVSSICCDVIGDIAGIISGSTTLAIVTRLVHDFGANEIILQLMITAAVAASMIGGKAMGKNLSIHYSIPIVFTIGKIIAFFKGIFSIFKRKTDNTGLK